MLSIGSFRETWAIDTEFRIDGDGLAVPVCLCGVELNTGRMVRLKFDRPQPNPLGTGPDVLYVGFALKAEWDTFLSLGWPLPAAMVDLYYEFKRVTNNRLGIRHSLLNALGYYGRNPEMSAAHKDTMRDIILAGGEWSEDTWRQVLDYCMQDAINTGKLFFAMQPDLSKHSLIRGEYSKAEAIIYRNGIPIDTRLAAKIAEHRQEIRLALIEADSIGRQVYDQGSFKAARFMTLLRQMKISWPIHPGGTPKLDEDTFKLMAGRHRKLESLYQLRSVLKSLKANSLAIMADGRNRAGLNPFGSTTGRNQPRGGWIFGLTSMLRSLIKPAEGMAVAYVDFSQEEFAIIAAYSGDPAMLADYESGDPYLGFAIRAGLAPPWATKASHKAIRDRCKQLVLATQYGQEAASIALVLNISQAKAEQLLDQYWTTYHVARDWLRRVAATAALEGELRTPLGWTVTYAPGCKKFNRRSAQNFPAQAGGAEILRVAATGLVSRAIRVVALVHDAVLLECPIADLDRVVPLTQKIMADAAEAIIGIPLRSDAKVVTYPDRYIDGRGHETWELIMWLLGETEEVEPESLRLSHG